jgi:hypothetical protein|tara:strand:- start:105 stop:323 length:219 start_codon:yes stop_codon:yes gene_type:complete
MAPEIGLGMNPDDYEMVDLPYVQILADDCEIIAELQCFDYFQAKVKRNRALGEGKIARIIYKKVPWQDSIPF